MKSVKFPSSGRTLMRPNLPHMDFLDDPAAIHGSRLTISRFTKDERSNEHINPEILSNNHLKFIYSFTWYLPAFIPDGVMSSCACIVLLSEASSSSHVEFNIARQRGPLSPETSIWACLTASNHEIHHMSITLTTLTPPNLSHMDFLYAPAALH